jgi:hypothetical protein
VNGKLYNTKRSVLWHFYSGETTAALSSNSIILQVSKLVPAAYRIGAYTGRGIPIAWEEVPGIKLVMLNCPEKEMAVGEKVSLMAMQIGTTNCNGEVLRLLDCGKPHIVAVVTTNYPTANHLTNITN